MKRIFDIIFSLIGLIIFSPFFIILIFLIWIQDLKNPIYSATRVGKKNKKFTMYKLRSMKIYADTSGVESTAVDDKRITKVGKVIRRFKMDELSQLINVFFGSMSLVGPRPNTLKGVRNYSQEEIKLLDIKPGITDFASIVFSDEGDILKSSLNPDLDYEKLIRPRKSLLGLFYVKKSNNFLDLILCLVTLVAIFSRPKALYLIVIILRYLEADDELIMIGSRKEKLFPLSHP